MAGILVNLIIYFVIKIFKFNVPNTVYYFNLIMLLINILPIYPLDGYRILSKILNKIFDPEYTFEFLFWISIFFIFLSMLILYFFRIYFVILTLIFLIINLIIKRKKELGILRIKKLNSILMRVK